MKTIIRPVHLLMISALFFTLSLSAQNTREEATAFMQRWAAAYNRKDTPALQDVYTKKAELTGPTGVIITGSDSIVSIYALDFKNSDTTATMTVTISKTEATGTGTIQVWGNWQASGKLKDTGQPYNIKGTYVNTIIKEEGKWRISKSVLKIL